MPFYWIESILAISFTLVWVFIGMTLLGDRLSEVRQRRSAKKSVLQGPHHASQPHHAPQRGVSLRRRRKQRGNAVDRIAV